MEVWTLDGKLDAQPNAAARTAAQRSCSELRRPVSGTAGRCAARARAPAWGRTSSPATTSTSSSSRRSPSTARRGIPTPFLDRKKSDLVVVRVTDETVPDAGKKRYALSLSIHGIERAGLEGGTRAMEDLVTADETGARERDAARAAERQGRTRRRSPTRSTRRSSTSPTRTRTGGGAARTPRAGVFFQRYNGNGVDLNRDWPDIGFTLPPLQRPVGAGDPRAPVVLHRGPRQLRAVRRRRRPPRAAVRRRALVHAACRTGSHDYGKDVRIRETAKTIHRASYEALEVVAADHQANDQPPPDCAEHAGASAPPAPRSTARPGARSTTRSTTRRPARSATGSTRASG